MSRFLDRFGSPELASGAMKRAGIGLAVVLVASTVVLSAQTASANDNDIFLSGLVIR